LGLTLRQLLERMGPLPVAPALEIARQLASALDYAHGRRGPSGQPEPVVHRDVSPHNVLVGVDGRTRLSDFGVARAAASGAHGAVECGPRRSPGAGVAAASAAPAQLWQG
jgi:serine/threonine-protein kinase